MSIIQLYDQIFVIQLSKSINKSMVLFLKRFKLKIHSFLFILKNLINLNSFILVSDTFRYTRLKNQYDSDYFSPYKLVYYINPNEKLTFAKRFFLNILLIISRRVILSDLDSLDFYFKNFFGVKIIQTSVIMWNNYAEFSSCMYLDKIKKNKKIEICYYFKEGVEETFINEKIKSRKLTSPLVYNSHKSEKFENKLIYASEVNIVPSLKLANQTIDSQLWEYSNKIVFESSSYLYDENSIKSFFNLEIVKLNLVFYEGFNILWILKNRVRYLYCLNLKKIYADNFILIGDDWKNLGFDALSSNYNLDNLFQHYSESKLCIDLLSKSSNESIFERVSQTISFSNAFLQLRTEDSLEVYKEFYFEKITFINFNDLICKIDEIFKSPVLDLKNNHMNFKSFYQKNISKPFFDKKQLQ